jgi:hypothetical protein
MNEALTRNMTIDELWRHGVIPDWVQDRYSEDLEAAEEVASRWEDEHDDICAAFNKLRDGVLEIIRAYELDEDYDDIVFDLEQIT